MTGAALVLVLCTLLDSRTAAAGPIIGGVEWLQPTLAVNYSWNDIHAVCGGGTCSGQLGTDGPDLSGWRWASAAELGDLLLAPSSGHPGGIADWFEPTTAGLDLINLGLGPTTTIEQNLVDGIYAVFGFTASSARNGQPYWGGGGLDLGFTGPGGSFFFSNATGIAADTPDETVGAWLYRAVPLPGSTTLVVFGLVGVMLRARVRGR